MGTRATYKIEKTTFYIHYDGYEEGAAQYFLNMVRAQSEIDRNGMPTNRGGNAENFLRANRLAEFTESHELHGDTEYEYDLKGDQLTVRSGYGEEKKQTFQGPLVDFLQKYAPGEVVTAPLNNYGHKALMTRDNVEQLLSSQTELLGKWVANDVTGANLDSLKKTIDGLQECLA